MPSRTPWLRRAACLSALSCFPLFLAPAVGRTETLLLEPVTLVASRHERALPTTPASVTVLDEAALAPLASLPLDDILATHAGVTLARAGGPGQQASLFLRGTNSDSVLVLIDGVKANGGSFGGANLQNLRGADIARVEVVRGPRSTLYGSEAVGGVVAITTRRSAATAPGEALDRASLRAGGGSHGTREAHATASHHAADRHVALGIGDWRSDGEPVATGTGVDGAHANTSGTINASTRLGNTRVGIDGWAAHGRTAYAACVYDLSFTCTGTTAAHQDFTQESAALWSRTDLSATLDGVTLAARAGYANDDLAQQESTDFAQTRRWTGSLGLEHRGARHVLVAGIDAEREDVNARIYGGDLVADTTSEALFARHEITAGRHQVALGARHVDDDRFGGEATGDASWGYTAAGDTYLWLAAGRGFRAPDASERFGYGGNPALAPERTDGVEAGVRARTGAHGWTVTAFRQRIRDLIDFPAPSYVATNIARARITGAELGWSWQAGATRADAMATWLDAVDDRTDTPLPRRPRQSLSATLGHRTGSVDWHATVRAMDRRDNSSYDDIELPGFAALDLGADWTARPGLTLALRVENAGDTAYALAADANLGDYRMPGRGVFLGVAWQGESRYRRP